jgi:hypothetical protein
MPGRGASERDPQISLEMRRRELLHKLERPGSLEGLRAAVREGREYLRMRPADREVREGLTRAVEALEMWE